MHSFVVCFYVSRKGLANSSNWCLITLSINNQFHSYSISAVYLCGTERTVVVNTLEASWENIGIGFWLIQTVLRQQHMMQPNKTTKIKSRIRFFFRHIDPNMQVSLREKGYLSSLRPPLWQACSDVAC